MIPFRAILAKKAITKFLYGGLAIQKRYCSRHRNYILDFWRERIGNREIVGYGFNGQPCYHDRPDFPFPAIRFGEPTAEIIALRQKEKGDWRLLTIEEKKRLYRYSFGQTFAEFLDIGTNWMKILGWALIWTNLGAWIYFYEMFFVHDELPDSYTFDSKMEQLARQLDLRVNEITGQASEFDYENKVWKKQYWFSKRPNPFEEEQEECEQKES